MINYVYICSAGHSGSTLLDFLLGSHSRACSLGEISHLPKNIALNTSCSCGVNVLSCSVWKKIILRISSILEKDLTKDPYALHLGYPIAANTIDTKHQNVLYKVHRKIIHAIRYCELRFDSPLFKVCLTQLYQSLKNNILLYDVIREVRNKEIIVDSSKDYLKGIGLYLTKPKQVKLILLTRDGRGVLYSGIKRKYSIPSIIKGWKNYYSRAIPLINKHVDPNSILQVKYEELVADPSATLSKVCEFIGISFESSMLDYQSCDHHTTNGNNMRLSSSSKIKADKEWEYTLLPGAIKHFDRMAGDLNRKLGYL